MGRVELKYQQCNFASHMGLRNSNGNPMRSAPGNVCVVAWEDESAFEFAITLLKKDG